MGGKRRISCLHVRFQPVFVKCGVCGCVAERYLKQPAAGQRRTSHAASSARFCKRAYLCALRGPEDACGKQTRLLTPYPAGRGGIRAGGRGGRASRRLAAQGGKPRISSKIPLLFETSPFRGKRAVDKTAKPMKSARPLSVGCGVRRQMGRPRHVSYRRQAACPVSRRNPPCLLPRIFPFWKCVVHTSMPQDSGLLSRKRRTAGECRARPLSVHSPAVTDYDLSVSPASAMECFLPLRAPATPSTMAKPTNTRHKTATRTSETIGILLKI